MRNRSGFAAAFVFLLLSCPPSARAAFRAEAIDPGGMAGLHGSLALDSLGNIHVSYYDQASGDLEYAKKAGGFWAIETVDELFDVGYASSLALDPLANPRISYLDLSLGNLKYASKSGSAWTIQSVGSAGSITTGAATSLALDVAGNPFISYSSSGSLRFARKSIGLWQTETAHEQGATLGVGRNNRIALDAAGNPHIGHGETGAGTLWYATKSGGSWSREIIDPDYLDTGLNRVGIATDGDGNVHVSYGGQGPAGLRYATRSQGAWVIELVDTGPDADFTALVIDDQKSPHVAYRVALTGGDLRYARRGAGSWTVEFVDDSSHAAGDFASIGLGENAEPFISHFRPSAGLWLAHREPTGLPAPPVAGGRLALTVYPNPTAGPATILCELVRTGPVEVAIYDVAGRRIAQLAMGDASERARLAWNGRDGRGRAVPPGTYLVRARTNHESAVGRITISPGRGSR